MTKQDLSGDAAERRHGNQLIAEAFAGYFAHWQIRLPEADLEQRRRGTIHAAGWTIQYLFGEDERGAYLDFYATHRMTNDRHHRIYADGRMDDLPAPHDVMVFPPNASDAERKRIEREYYKHNQEIGALLRGKGFH